MCRLCAFVLKATQCKARNKQKSSNQATRQPSVSITDQMIGQEDTQAANQKKKNNPIERDSKWNCYIQCANNSKTKWEEESDKWILFPVHRVKKLRQLRYKNWEEEVVIHWFFYKFS